MKGRLRKQIISESLSQSKVDFKRKHSPTVTAWRRTGSYLWAQVIFAYSYDRKTKTGSPQRRWSSTSMYDLFQLIALRHYLISSVGPFKQRETWHNIFSLLVFKSLSTGRDYFWGQYRLKAFILGNISVNFFSCFGSSVTLKTNKNNSFCFFGCDIWSDPNYLITHYSDPIF